MCSPITQVGTVWGIGSIGSIGYIVCQQIIVMALQSLEESGPCGRDTAILRRLLPCVVELSLCTRQARPHVCGVCLPALQ
jgi:hypothetical protein